MIPEARTSPEDSLDFLERLMINAVRLLANHPRQADALINFVRSVRYSNSLTPTLTELAYTTASVVNRCHY